MDSLWTTQHAFLVCTEHYFTCPRNECIMLVHCMTYSVTFALDMPFICIQSSLFLVLGMSCSCKLNYCALSPTQCLLLKLVDYALLTSIRYQYLSIGLSDNALNSSLYPTLSVWNTGQSSATETAFDNYRSTSIGRF